jgi:hypothetical protein
MYDKNVIMNECNEKDQRNKKSAFAKNPLTIKNKTAFSQEWQL